MANHLYKGDLPSGLSFGASVAVDSETMGLSLIRDQLCLVQLSDGGPEAHLVQLDRNTYEAPNLKRVLTEVQAAAGGIGPATVMYSGRHVGLDRDRRRRRRLPRQPGADRLRRIACRAGSR